MKFAGFTGRVRRENLPGQTLFNKEMKKGYYMKPAGSW
jgi:hypothetical protein